MNDFLENLKREAEENPVVALGVAAALLTAVNKFMDSRTWRKEVNRRIIKTTRK